MSQEKVDKFKEINKILSLDDKYSLQKQQKERVKSILEQQVHYLMDKKQKENRKKKKIMMMEEEFQKQRKNKIQQFQGKISQSSKAKQAFIKQKVQKNKKSLEYVQKVQKKVHQQYNSIVEQGLQKRKDFYRPIDKKSNRSSSIKSITQQSFRKNLTDKSIIQQFNTSRCSKEIESITLTVEEQMKQIQQKISKAKNNQKLYQKQIISKLNQKDRIHSEIKQKIRSHSIVEEQKSFKQLYGKNEHILHVEQKVKSWTEEHLSNRRKNFEDKIKKLQENIKYIQSEKQQKYAQLESKLTKINESHSINSKENKLRSYRQKVIMNNLKLEEQKKQKAEEILKKHSQITIKNKIFKEKKDQILQTIKKVNPEVNE